VVASKLVKLILSTLFFTAGAFSYSYWLMSLSLSE